MASRAVVRPLAAVSASIGLKRGFATAQRCNKTPFQQPLRAGTKLDKQQLRAGFRRGYADKLPDKQQVKKGSWRVLKWTWRLTYLSVLGGLGWVSYGIWQNRNPVEQQEPDPTKKTLVVLGRAEMDLMRLRAHANHLKEPAGDLSLCSRTSTLRTTTSS